MAVSLKLAPYGTLGAASAGMLSADGRCKTLDARANGYARSEAVGSVVLTADEIADMLLASSAVRQDGRSASLTAPNGSAQRVLLLAALGRASIRPAEIGVFEAHGTGTALGDPTEAGSFGAVHGSANREMPLIIGAAKGALGHSEAASGQVGLLRVCRVLERLAASGNAQLRMLNPLVGERLASSSADFVLPTQGVPSSLSCGVSSFGYSGTIAHAVLHCTAGAIAAVAALVYHRRSFMWQEGHGAAKSARASLYTLCWIAAPSVRAIAGISCVWHQNAQP